MALVFLALASCGAYLYLSYGHIYRKIGNARLHFPDVKHSYMIPSNVKGSDETYVSLGDSLTAGVGVDDYTESYPYLLAQKLSKTEKVSLMNFSYPGAKTADVIAVLPDAVASDPQIVTLLIGVNDIHAKVPVTTFEQRYRTVVDTLTKETDAKIYLISIPYIGSNTLLLPPFDSYFRYKTGEFNEVIRRIAAEYKVPYIDIATPTQVAFEKDGPLYAADSFHPSAAGYKLWSDIIYADIRP